MSLTQASFCKAVDPSHSTKAFVEIVPFLSICGFESEWSTLHIFVLFDMYYKFAFVKGQEPRQQIRNMKLINDKFPGPVFLSL